MGISYPSALSAEQEAKLDSLPKEHFGIASTTSVSVGTDSSSPQYVLGQTLFDDSSDNFSLITNTAGDYWVKYNELATRTISMTGTVTFQVDNGTGGTAEFHFWSERSSDDGETFVENDFSLRTTEVGNTVASSQTKSSGVLDLAAGECIRFAFYNAGSGNLTIDAPSDTVNGNTISGYSFFWELSEK